MAAFKKYVGMVSGAVQKYIDTNLVKCPFCGETSDWQADTDSDLKSGYNFRCSKCGAVLSVPTAAIVNPFKVLPENVTALSTGSVNANRLHPGTTYSVQFLIAGGLRLSETAAVKQDIASLSGAPASPAPEVVFSEKKLKRDVGKRVALTLLLLLLLGGSIAAIAINVPKAAHAADEQPQVVVREGVFCD